MIHLASIFPRGLIPDIVFGPPLLATEPNSETTPMVLAGFILSLVFIYLMIPRGEVGLVFAGIGAASGVLDKPLQAAIIIMVILTTFVAPPLLRFAFQEDEKPLVQEPDLAIEN